MPHPFVARLYQKLSRLLGAAKQGREDRQVGEQNVAGPRARRRHPQKRIEFRVPRLDERVWSGQIHRLSSKNTNCIRIFRGQRIVRQVLVKIEGRDVREPTMPVQITHGRQRRDLVGALDDCRTKAEAILHRYAEALMRDRVYKPKRCWRGTRGSP